MIQSLKRRPPVTNVVTFHIFKPGSPFQKWVSCFEFIIFLTQCLTVYAILQGGFLQHGDELKEVIFTA